MASKEDGINKVALVTGSSRGIGRAIAIELAKRDITAIINNDKATEEGERVVDEIKKIGGNAIYIKADVSDPNQVEKMIEKIMNRFGRIAILVNNAGITRDITLKKMSKEVWDEVIDVNLNGVFNCTKALINHMRERKTGRIINISSIIGFTGNIGQANYAAAKSGIIGFSKALAREVARAGITVNVIAPGFINTDMLKIIPEDIKKQLLEQIPMGRFGEPEEVAKVAAFLASEDASFITGAVIHVNGGLYM